MLPERSDSAPYPIDFDALRKGDVVSPEVISAVYGVERSSRGFQVCALNLKDRIERALGERGYPVTVKTEMDAIRILTDAEAVQYNAASFERGVSAMARSHRRLAAVDHAQLDARESEKRDRLLLNQATQLLALRRSRRALPAPNPQKPDAEEPSP